MRLDLGYDGTGFSGWARQPGLRTVQGEIEVALATVLRLGEAPQLTVAGRTDAGVHARGQVAHVDVRPLVLFLPLAKMHLGARNSPEARAYLHDRDDVAACARLVRSLNGLLPVDIRIHEARPAAPGFDARFSALARRYSYRVCDGQVDPLRRHDTLAYPRTLDLGAMNAAAAQLLGEHDFAAFCRRREGATTVRGLLAFEWARADDGVAVARVEADAFCHSMVRSLVGALLAVGDGRRPVDWPSSVLATGVRDPAVMVVAAHGLTLEEVRYPPDDRLAERDRQTRRRRDGAAASLVRDEIRVDTLASASSSAAPSLARESPDPRFPRADIERKHRAR